MYVSNKCKLFDIEILIESLTLFFWVRLQKLSTITGDAINLLDRYLTRLSHSRHYHAQNKPLHSHSNRFWRSHTRRFPFALRATISIRNLCACLRPGGNILWFTLPKLTWRCLVLSVTFPVEFDLAFEFYSFSLACHGLPWALSSQSWGFSSSPSSPSGCLQVLRSDVKLCQELHSYFCLLMLFESLLTRMTLLCIRSES